MKRRDFVKLGATTFACGNITATYADDKKQDDTAVLFLFLGISFDDSQFSLCEFSFHENE